MNASRTLRAASALLGLLFVANQGLAQLDRSKAPEPGPAPELNMGSSTQLELENGLNIIVVENHRTPSVYWNLTLEFPPFLEGNKAGLQAVASDMATLCHAKLSPFASFFAKWWYHSFFQFENSAHGPQSNPCWGRWCLKCSLGRKWWTYSGMFRK